MIIKIDVEKILNFIFGMIVEERCIKLEGLSIKIEMLFA